LWRRILEEPDQKQDARCLRKLDESKLEARPAGSFFTEPRGVRHFRMTKDEVAFKCQIIPAAILQTLSGPWAFGPAMSFPTSLGRLGVPDAPFKYSAAANLAISGIREVLEEFGTLIVPTFTYSIGRGETYDVENTPSEIGEFSEHFRTHSPNVIRSADPMMSHAGVGPSAEWILRDIFNSCYGPGSVFDNLTKADAWIVTLGLGMWWATYIHHIEKVANVPFRFDKKFTGIIRENGKERTEEWTYFAAPRVPNCESNSPEFEAKQCNLCRHYYWK
jgi:Aminoglycoside 3-N-acetyltransferase